MVSPRDYSEQNLAAGSAGTKGLLFFAHAVSCYGNLCLSQDPPEWIQLSCQQISAYKRPAAQGRHLASPKDSEPNRADAHLSSLSHVGKAGSNPVLLQSLWPQELERQRASPAPAELGVAGGCFTAEQTGSVCASDTWAMANCRNQQKFSKSLNAGLAALKYLSLFDN